MKLNKKNKYIILSLLILSSMFFNGCSEVKKITNENNNTVTSTLESKESVGKTIASELTTNIVPLGEFVNIEFEKDVSDIFIQCNKGWETKNYQMDNTGGKSVVFAKKYKSLENLNEYEKQVYTDIVELDNTTYDYFKWIPKDLNPDKTPTMKIRIETLIAEYHSIFIN